MNGLFAISSGVPRGIYSGVLPGISPNVSTGVLPGIPTRVVPGISSRGCPSITFAILQGVSSEAPPAISSTNFRELSPIDSLGISLRKILLVLVPGCLSMFFRIYSGLSPTIFTAVFLEFLLGTF